MPRECSGHSKHPFPTTQEKTLHMDITRWLSEEALQIAEIGREAKGKGEKERYTHLNAEFQRIARREKKAFLHDLCKEIEGKSRMGKTEISSRKLETPRKHFIQRRAMPKNVPATTQLHSSHMLAK